MKGTLNNHNKKENLVRNVNFKKLYVNPNDRATGYKLQRMLLDDITLTQFYYNEKYWVSICCIVTYLEFSRLLCLYEAEN